MAKHLIVVESPAKTRTLKKFLGRDWAVEASVGHIRDLPKKDMGLGSDYEPKYTVLPEKREVVKRLQEAAKRADSVYLAPDPDREGEAIAWHVAEVLKGRAQKIYRVTFNEITKNAVLSSLMRPGEIDHRLVEAQQARRVLDRLMGFKLSPLLWEKVKRGLSAGRVQSVALKMVCDRQEEIDRFQPEEYWNLAVELQADEPPTFRAKVVAVRGKKVRVRNAQEAAELADELAAGQFTVAEVAQKVARQRPQPPFITSRLQQEAARRFGFAVKRTMALAQGLYEGRAIGDRGPLGLITYMRTDSTRVAQEAVVAVRDYIASTYGSDKLPEKPNSYRSKAGAQDAHEAIRPTFMDLPPEAVAPYLAPDELKLYRLIWDRFIASQMQPAVFDATEVLIRCRRLELKATGRVLRSAGYLAVYQDLASEDGESEDESRSGLPRLQVGQILTCLEIFKEQKFTQPPPAYSEATLVKALEENGIGRPSTYAQILATLTTRDYVEKIEGRFRPTPLGKVVNRLLQQEFHDVLNEGYTANLELELDRVEEGKLAWKQVVVEFDRKFERDLKSANQRLPNVKADGLPLDEPCPRCGAPLVLRFGRFGPFTGCSSYRSDPPCEYTRSFGPEPERPKESDSSPEVTPPCEKCGKPMVLRRSRFGVFLGCSGYPECRSVRKLGAPVGAAPKETGVACPRCQEGQIVEKRSRRGKVFFACNRYPNCDFALWDPPRPSSCPRCGFPVLVEKTSKRRGREVACPNEGCGYRAPAEEFDDLTA